MDKQLTERMNAIVADLTVMYMKLHHYHWFVKGPLFFTLHEKFEELYDEVTGHVDDLAERLLTLNEAPISTLKKCLELTSIKEATGIGTAEEMVEEVIADFTAINETLLQCNKDASEAGDEGTADLLLGMSTSFEKHMWMLRAFLGN